MLQHPPRVVHVHTLCGSCTEPRARDVEASDPGGGSTVESARCSVAK